MSRRGAVVGAAVELYEPLAEERGLALRFDSTPGTIIEGDRHLLSQAVANLLDNAFKYGGGEDGGGREIVVGVGRRGGHALITVADRGLGIPAADRESV